MQILNNLPIINFADYDCNTYGSGSYDKVQSCSDSLAYTGYDIWIPIALGGAIIIASAIWLFKKYKRRKR